MKRVYNVLKEIGLAVEWKVQMWGVVTDMMMGMMECESKRWKCGYEY